MSESTEDLWVHCLRGQKDEIKNLLLVIEGDRAQLREMEREAVRLRNERDAARAEARRLRGERERWNAMVEPLEAEIERLREAIAASACIADIRDFGCSANSAGTVAHCIESRASHDARCGLCEALEE